MRKWLLVAAVGGATLLAGCGSSGPTTHDAAWHAGYRYAVANQKQADSDIVLGHMYVGDPDQNWCMLALPENIPGTTPAASDWIVGCVAGLRATIGEPSAPLTNVRG